MISYFAIEHNACGGGGRTSRAHGHKLRAQMRLPYMLYANRKVSLNDIAIQLHKLHRTVPIKALCPVRYGCVHG